MYVLGAIAAVALVWLMGVSAGAVEPWRTPIDQLEIVLFICSVLSFVAGAMFSKRKKRIAEEENWRV